MARTRGPKSRRGHVSETSTALKVHKFKILKLSDCLAHALGFLNIRTIYGMASVCKEFKKRCREAVKQMKCFQMERQPGSVDVLLPILFREGPDLEIYDGPLPRCSEFICAVKAFSNLRELHVFNNPPFQSVHAQHYVIPTIADNLRQLKKLSLLMLFSTQTVDFRPLKTLELTAFFFVGRGQLQHVIGLPLILQNTKLESLGLANFNCDITHMIQASPIHPKVRSLFLVKVSAHDISRVIVHRFPNVKRLGLLTDGFESSQVTPLLPMKELEHLSLDMTKVDALGICVLSQFTTFPKLKKFFCHGETYSTYLDVIRAGHPLWRIELGNWHRFADIESMKELLLSG